MALSLKDLRRRAVEKPPIIAIYGREKIGKTTLASEFPNPVFVQTEDGGGNLDFPTFSDKPFTTLAEVNEALDVLAQEEHDQMTLVFDSVTHLEPLIWAATCARCGFISMDRGSDGKSNFGAGYREAETEWHAFFQDIAWLRDNKGMTIILIGHETTEKVDEASTDTYGRYTVRLHKGGGAILREKVDVLGYMAPVVIVTKEKAGFKESVKAKGSGQMALNLSPRPGFQAGNRCEMPSQVLINKGSGYAALAPYLPGHRAPAAVKAA